MLEPLKGINILLCERDLKFFSHLELPLLKQHIIPRRILFRFNTLKSAAIGPTVPPASFRKGPPPPDQ